MLRFLPLAFLLAGTAAAQSPFVNISAGPQGAPLSGPLVQDIGVVGDSVLATGVFRVAR